MTDIHDEIARAQSRPTITQVLQRMQPEIARAVPKGMDPDRIARLALTVIRQSEMAKRKGIAKTSLAECTPESFAGALLTAAALGLEPGVDGEAWLIPYGKECTFVPGYKGIAKLFWQHPLARHLDAQAVYENDDFDYQLGLDPYLRHKPAHGDRGKITHYYAVASLSTGAQRFEVMTADEVAAVRDASPRRSNDIRDPQRWMERKTVLKQLLKTMPKSTTLQHALAADEQSGTELARDQTPRMITETPPAAIESIDTITGEVTSNTPTAEAAVPETSPPDTGVAGGDGGDTSSEAVVPPPSEPVAEPGPDPVDSGADAASSGEADAAAVSTGRATGPRSTVTQQAEITRHFQRLEVEEMPERLWWMNRLADLPEDTVAATKELKKAEAIKVIAALEQFTDRDQLDASINQDPLVSND